MNYFNGEGLLLARESRGVRQKDLAEMTGLTQGRISRIEAGLAVDVSEDEVDKFSTVLALPKSTFYCSDPIHPAFSFQFRKRSGLPVKQTNQLRAILNRLHRSIDRMLANVEIEAGSPLSGFNVDDPTSPESVAVELRRYLGLPRGPINDMIAAVESMGILVKKIDLTGELGAFYRQFDGVRIKRVGGAHVVFLNSTAPTDRQRFTLAHELGHVVLHSSLTSSSEQEANSFAAEFLTPRVDVIAHLQATSGKLADFITLKARWKVSIKMLIKRAFDLGVIDSERYKSLMIQYGARGWVKNGEPVILDEEVARIERAIVDYHVDTLRYSRSEMSQFLHLNYHELTSWMGLPDPANNNVHKVKIFNLQ